MLSNKFTINENGLNGLKIFYVSKKFFYLYLILLYRKGVINIY